MLENEKAFQFMNINAADSNGVSLVMLAVQYERTKILYHLLDYGAGAAGGPLSFPGGAPRASRQLSPLVQLCSHWFLPYKDAA